MAQNLAEEDEILLQCLLIMAVVCSWEVPRGEKNRHCNNSTLLNQQTAKFELHCSLILKIKGILYIVVNLRNGMYTQVFPGHSLLGRQKFCQTILMCAIHERSMLAYR